MDLLYILNRPVVYTILGIIIGFILSFLKDFFKDKKLNQNIRILIITELKFNKKLLEDFEMNTKLSNNDLSISSPKFSLTNWNKLITDIPSAFNEDELKLIYSFYNKLYLLIESKNWIKPVVEKENLDIYGQINKLSKPFTEKDQEFIDYNKKEICKKIKEILEIYNKFPFL